MIRKIIVYLLILTLNSCFIISCSNSEVKNVGVFNGITHTEEENFNNFQIKINLNSYHLFLAEVLPLMNKDRNSELYLEIADHIINQRDYYEDENFEIIDSVVVKKYRFLFFYIQKEFHSITFNLVDGDFTIDVVYIYSNIYAKNHSIINNLIKYNEVEIINIGLSQV